MRVPRADEQHFATALCRQLTDVRERRRQCMAHSEGREFFGQAAHIYR